MSNRRVKGEIVTNRYDTRSGEIVAIMRGPCPECGTANHRIGYGRVACRECGLIYELVEHNEFI